MPPAEVNLHNLVCTEGAISTLRTEFDLRCEVWEENQEITGELTYNSMLFAQQTGDRLKAYYTSALSSIVEKENSLVKEVSLTNLQGTPTSMAVWHGDAKTYFRKPLHSLFETQVKCSPDATALIEDKLASRTISYSDLNNQANLVGRYLQHYGVQKGQTIGISMQRSIEQVVCLLAIIKAGCAYVPIEPGAPKERVEFILKDAMVGVTFTDQADNNLPDSAQVINIQDQWQNISKQPASNIDVTVNSNELFQVIYTSGSTGFPKGIRNAHKGAVNCIDWLQNTYPFAEQEVCCHKTSIAFVDSVMEIFAPLVYGKPLVLITDEVVRDSVAFIHALEAH
ncbi:MAG: surfactin family lipopeptide synthetase A [Parasphingorhabdus sp.]|jgi:surfactin family lipopeptide synthetase A